MRYQLISFDLCPYVQRSVITLKQKGVAFDLAYIDLHAPPEWFLAISPMGKVPVLRVEDTVLFESAVINEYLDETNPPPYHPADPLRRAHNRAWIEFGSNLIGRQYRLMTAPDKISFGQESQGMRADLGQVDAQLGEGPFFNGADFALIDAAYAPLFMRFALVDRYYPLGLLDESLRLRRWSDALLALPSVRDSVIADFETRFRRYFSAAGGYIGSYLR